MNRFATAEVTRPNDTTAYAANDVVTGGTPAMLEFKPNGGGPGEILKLVSAVLVDSAAEATKPDLDLLLFDATQSDVDADNAAYSPTDAQAKTLVGVVSFAGSTFKIAGAAANGLIVVSNIWLMVPLDQNAKLYGLLVARNAYTPILVENFVVKLGFETGSA